MFTGSNLVFSWKQVFILAPGGCVTARMLPGISGMHPNACHPSLEPEHAILGGPRPPRIAGGKKSIVNLDRL